MPSRPVVPPRKKKNQKKKLSNSSSENFNLNEGMSLPPLDNNNIDNRKFERETESLKNFSNRESYDDIISTRSQIESDKNNIAKTGAVAGDNTIETFQRELEKTFSKDNNGNSGTTTTNVGASRKSASLNRIYQSLGNSNTSINSKASPSNSAKSNSAPSRVR